MLTSLFLRLTYVGAEWVLWILLLLLTRLTKWTGETPCEASSRLTIFRDEGHDIQRFWIDEPTTELAVSEV